MLVHGTLLFVLLTLCLQTFRVRGRCHQDTVAVYEAFLETFWHRKDFPKHYPEFRPPASWSKTIGFTHDAAFEVFRKGELASVGLKQFAERADCSQFDLYAQGQGGVFDVFNIAPIQTGVGSSKTVMMMDANHTKVSMVSKIIPSPDWFIGVDSFDLCANGRWLEFAHLEMGPLDAGTDQGFTFTSPNWPSDPAEVIQDITSHFPSHPAGSFYYPEIDELPVLAQLTLTKQREYNLRTDFDAADHSQDNFVPESKKSIYRYDIEDNSINLENPNIRKIEDTPKDRLKNQVNIIPNEKRRPQPGRRFGPFKPYNGINNTNRKRLRYRTTTRPDSIQTTKSDVEKEQDQTSPVSNSITSSEESKSRRPNNRFNIPKLENGRRARTWNGRRGRKRIPSGDVMAVIDDIVKDYQKEHRRMIKKRREERRKRREHTKKIKPPRDCRVSEWMDWSSCSKTCGIGEQTRKRKIIKHARRGGKPCPALHETTWCGSARACPRDYFNWKK